MTWIVLFLVWPAVWLIWKWGTPRQAAHPPQRVAQLLAIGLLSVYVINVGYAFEGSFRRLSDFSFVSTTFARQRSRQCAHGRQSLRRYLAGSTTRAAAEELPSRN